MARSQTRGKPGLSGLALSLRVSTTRDRVDTAVASSPRPQTYASEGFAGFRVGGVGGWRGGPARGKATSCCSWRPGGGAAHSGHSRPPGCPWSSEAGNRGAEGKALRRRPPEPHCRHMPTRCSFLRGSHSPIQPPNRVPLSSSSTQQPELCSRWAGGDPPALSGRPHSVNVLLPILEATPAWVGGTAVPQTYLRGQGAGIEL